MKGMKSFSQESRMGRERRTHILIEGNRTLSQLMCAHIEELYNVDLVSGPRAVLVMNRVRESAQKSLFNLGEALLTECKVSIEAKEERKQNTRAQGLGLVLGQNRAQAYELAVIDAAFCLEETLPQHEQWSLLLEEEEQRLYRERAQGTVLLDATRVEFNRMDTNEEKKEEAR